MTNKTAKVTKIEKKYKDKKTGEYKSMMIEYSKVVDRIKEFRQDCPNGEIKTSLEIRGEYIFAQAIVVKDNTIDSAKATGHAVAKITGYEKEFEKLETLSVGRALAFLGYSAGGEIASSEEMEEFQKFQRTKKEQMIFDLMTKVDEITSLPELREFYKQNKGLGKELDEYITNKANELKNKTV